MPGHFHQLECPGCGVSHTVYTGVGQAGDVVWVYEPVVCAGCTRIRSVREPAVYDDEGCSDCGSRETAPWAGRVWFDDEPDGHSRERVEGPCPRCQEPLTLEHSSVIGLWD